MRLSIRVILFMALKDIFKDKRILALVVFALTIGYTNVLMSTAVMNSFIGLFYDQITDTTVPHIVVEPREEKKFIEHTESKVKNIEGIAGVVGVASHLNSSGIVILKNKNIGCSVVGITPSLEKNISIIPEKIEKGNFLNDKEKTSVLIGTMLADDLEVSVGQRVTLVYSNGVKREYSVKGIVNTGFLFVDMLNVYVTREEIESVFGTHDRSTEIGVRLADRDAVGTYKLLIMKQLPSDDVKTWEEKMGFFVQLIGVLKIIWNAIRMMGLLTVIVTIAIIIYVNVTSKRRQIGILKAIGARNHIVLGIFLLEAVLWSMMGTFFGLILSHVLAYILNSIRIVLPIGLLVLRISSEAILLTVLLIFIASLLAAFMPARQGSRINIIKAIWGG
jgi:ABC-type lipoprotein release transport system permease subunit